MKNGFIKLHRKLQDCWIWQIDKPFDERSAWIDLLLSANHSAVKIPFNGVMTIVERGQFITSVRKLSEKWKWNKDKVLKFLRLIESDGMIKRDSDKFRTLITIENYDIYQDKQDTKQTQQGTAEGTQQGTRDGHKPATNKNDKNDKNVKNDKNNKKESTTNVVPKKNFEPPSVDEVSEYIQSVGSKVDAEAFVAFYNSKDWMIGKNKMKNWKSAIVTWEKRNGLKREPPIKKEVATEEPIIDLWSD